MMMKTMNLSARRELLNGVRQTYQDADWKETGRALNGFIAAHGYDRKYVIRLRNSAEAPTAPKRSLDCQKYNDQVPQA